MAFFDFLKNLFKGGSSTEWAADGGETPAETAVEEPVAEAPSAVEETPIVEAAPVEPMVTPEAPAAPVVEEAPETPAA